MTRGSDGSWEGDEEVFGYSGHGVDCGVGSGEGVNINPEF